LIEADKLRKKTSTVDVVHNDQKAGYVLKLIKTIVVVYVIPVVIEKGEKRHQEFEKISHERN
jgi:hypothetical protein